MRKATGITLSVLIMMIMLVILLSYTAYYIDEVMLKPVINMQDSENSLRCFLALSNMLQSDYYYEGQAVPEGSLRSSLKSIYNNSNHHAVYYNDYFNQSLKMAFGDAYVVIADSRVFWTAVKVENLNPECTINIYGPFKSGVAGLFRKKGAEEAMRKWEDRIYGGQ